MRKISIVTTILLVGLFFVSACEKKETYLTGFQSFVEEVRQDYPNYTDSEWEKAHSNHDRFLDILYNKFGRELNESERIQILKLKGRYAALRIKGEALKIEGSMLEAENENDIPTIEEQNWNLD